MRRVTKGTPAGDLEGRIRELKQDIARRLRAVLPTIPEEEFERLIDQMAKIQFKYEAMEHDQLVRAPAARSESHQRPVGEQILIIRERAQI